MPEYRFDEIAINSKEKKKPTEEDKYTYIGLEHLDTGSLSVTRWGSEIAPVGDKLVMRKGDVLFGKRRAYQKKVAIAPFDGIFSAHGMVLRPKEAVITKEFFPLFISSDYFLDAAIKISVGSLSPTINWNDLKELVFTIPTIEEQKQIAPLIWAAIDAKNAYKKLLSSIDDLVKSQFIEMFGTAQNNEKGWPVMSMKEAALRLSDGPFGSNLKSEHYRPEGVRVIRLQNICGGYFLDDDKAYIGLDHYERIKKYTCRAGDIVIGTLGEPNLRACLIPSDIEIAINKADCVHYIPREELLDKQFVCAFINSPATLDMAIGDVHGNTRQRISSGQLAKLPIIIPPMQLQKEYAAFMEQSDKSKFELTQAIARIDDMIKTLMQG